VTENHLHFLTAHHIHVNVFLRILCTGLQK